MDLVFDTSSARFMMLLQSEESRTQTEFKIEPFCAVLRMLQNWVLKKKHSFVNLPLHRLSLEKRLRYRFIKMDKSLRGLSLEKSQRYRGTAVYILLLI